MPPMFQGTVIDAETIYLGMKIEEGFESLAKALGGSDDVMRLICSAINEKPSNRSAIGSFRDQTQMDSTAIRKEIRALKVALVDVLKADPTVPVTPNDLAKETA